MGVPERRVMSYGEMILEGRSWALPWVGLKFGLQI